MILKNIELADLRGVIAEVDPEKMLLITHAACGDGAAAAFAAIEYSPSIKVVYANYDSASPPNVDSDWTVVIADFSYKPETMDKLAKSVRQLIVLDHHEKAIKSFQEYYGNSRPIYLYHYDEEESGASLAWQAFHASPAPWIIEYAKDRDLWKHKLPYTREVNIFLSQEQNAFFYREVQEIYSLQRVQQLGSLLLKQHVKAVKSIADSSTFYQTPFLTNGDVTVEASEFGLRDFEFRVANCPRYFASDVCDEMNGNVNFAVTWHFTDKFGYSVRSKNGYNRAINVNDLCSRFGGGGHPHAAGIVTARPIYPKTYS